MYRITFKKRLLLSDTHLSTGTFGAGECETHRRRSTDSGDPFSPKPNSLSLEVRVGVKEVLDVPTDTRETFEPGTSSPEPGLSSTGTGSGRQHLIYLLGRKSRIRPESPQETGVERHQNSVLLEVGEGVCEPHVPSRGETWSGESLVFTEEPPP